MEPFEFLESVVVRDIGGYWSELAAVVRGDLQSAARHLAECGLPVRLTIGSGFGHKGEGATLDAYVGLVSLAHVLAASRSTTIITTPETSDLVQDMCRARGSGVAVREAGTISEFGHLVSFSHDLVMVGTGTGTRSLSEHPTNDEWTDVLAHAHHTVAIGSAPDDHGLGRIPTSLVAEITGVPRQICSPVATNELVVAATPLWGVWALCTGIALLNDRCRTAASTALTYGYVESLAAVVNRGLLAPLSPPDQKSPSLARDLDRSMLASVTHLLDDSLR